MPEIVYKCPKCGCEKIYAKPNGRRMGIYCIDCGSWIKWTKYSTMIEIYNNISDDDLGDRFRDLIVMRIAAVFQDLGRTGHLVAVHDRYFERNDGGTESAE